MTYNSFKSERPSRELSEASLRTMDQFKTVPVKNVPKERKGKILDTSVLVKPSQLPRDGSDMQKHAAIIKNYQLAKHEEAHENRIKIHRAVSDNKYYKKNLADLKGVFRKKQLVVPYAHPEMEKLPFEKLDEENRVTFDPEKLPRKQKKAYLKMLENSIEKKFGEPLDMATKVFQDFETKDFKAKRLREDLCHRNVIFNKKLDVMNDEFDEFIAALVAQLIF